MTIKVIVLYPQPLDEHAFEAEYLGRHLPLMRELLGPDVPLPTYRMMGRPERPAPYYRLAEIHFASEEQLDAFVRSGKAAIGGESSQQVSTGGTPIVAVCVAQASV